MSSSQPLTASALIAHFLATDALWSHSNFPFSAHVRSAPGNVALLTGENGSGKSLFVKCLQRHAKNHLGLELMSISIRERVGEGAGGDMMRQMMYGSQADRSTGASSIKILDRALHNAKAWHGGGHTPLVVFDEPDMGLSNTYARAMGEMLGREIRKDCPPGMNIVIVTHNRAFVRGLRLSYGTPLFVHMNTPCSLDEWMTDESFVEVDSLASLLEQCAENRRLVDSLQAEIATQQSKSTERP